MKRTLELLCIGLVAGGLLTGCPKKPDETTATATQTVAKPQTIAVATPETIPPAEPVNEENYNKALFEKTCVTAKIDDTEKQKVAIDEVYARYGFDEESFGKAQEQMKDKPEVTAALTAKMNDCTPELAASFGPDGATGTTAGTTGAEAKEKEVTKTKTPSKAWKSGAFTDGAVKGGDLEGAQLRLKINDDGKLSGSFQGKREGKGFSIPVNGEIQKDGAFTATGNRGPNNARVTGRYKSNQVQGSIQGTINKQGFRVNYVAK